MQPPGPSHCTWSWHQTHSSQTQPERQQDIVHEQYVARHADSMVSAKGGGTMQVATPCDDRSLNCDAAPSSLFCGCLVLVKPAEGQCKHDKTHSGVTRCVARVVLDASMRCVLGLDPSQYGTNTAACTNQRNFQQNTDPGATQPPGTSPNSSMHT